MDQYEHGDLGETFEGLLDVLLAALCPDYSVPSFADAVYGDGSYLDYRRRNAKRRQVAAQLRDRPAAAIAVADTVLSAIVHDEDVSSNRSLIEPMVATVGRRRVQEYLIATVTSGSPLQKVCSVRAWYWSQPMLVYRSSEALHANHPTAASKAASDEVADLRGWYRAACLGAFIECEHSPTREWLARGFVLDTSFYPPDLHDKVQQARAIAEANPIRFKDLLGKTSDGTTLAAIRPQDH